MRRRFAPLLVGIVLPVAALAGLIQPLHASASVVPTTWTENGAQAASPSGYATSGAAVGDLYGNGGREIVTAYLDGRVDVVNSGGGLIWQKSGLGAIHASPTLADLYGNGQLEVIVAGGDGSIWVWGPDGSTEAGWPQHDQYEATYRMPAGSGFFSSVAVGDLWGNGELELVAAGLDHHLYAWYSDGSLMNGFPIDLYDTVWDTPSLAPIEQNGQLDIVIGSDSSGGSTEPYPAGGVYWAFKPVGCSHLNGSSVGGTPQANCMAPGWPRTTNEVPWASTATGDIDKSGRVDVVSGSGTYFNPLTCPTGCSVNAFDQAGGNLAGAWPAATGGQMFASPAIGDTTGTGANLQVFDTSLGANPNPQGELYGWNANGSVRAGFPKILNQGSLYGSPVVGPIDGTGKNGVWTCAGGNLDAFSGTGAPGASYSLGGGLCASTPTIADIGTGTLNVIVTAGNGANSWKTFMFPIPGATVMPANAYPTSHGNMYRSGTGIPQAPAAPFNRNFVVAMYQDVLGRPTDPAGLAYWTAQLDGRLTRTQVAANVVYSDEYRGDVINADYNRMFVGRSADPGGLAFWTAYMRNGGTDEQVLANLISSPEYFADAGNNNGQFVSNVYRDLLDRASDPDGLNYWTAQLNRGTPRPTVVVRLLYSTEYRTDVLTGTGPPKPIVGIYPRYLHRPADAGGVSYWVGQMTAGARDEDIVLNFVASPEYFNAAQ